MADVLTGMLILTGEPETGLWCDVCLLPALCRWPLTTISPSGVGAGSSMSGCIHCLGYDEDDDDG